MKRTVTMTTGIALALFLAAAAYAGPDAGTKAEDRQTKKGHADVKAYQDKDKQRSENKVRGQKMRRQAIERESGAKATQPRQ